jgi:Na+/H+ antiporter NhaD/arsenite permease-like protein
LLTNIGGLLTLISSVPNIIVGKAAQFTFIEFFQVSWFYVAMATVLTLMMGAKIFKIQKLQSDEEKKEALHLVSGFDENDGIESKGFFNFATVMLLLFIVTIAATSALPVLRDFGMAFVAMAFALFMLFRYKSEVDQFYRGLDWDLLGFFAALFVVINVMEHAQVLVKIGDVLKHIIDLEKTARGLGTGTLLLTSAGFSSVTDNIPLAAMLSNILENMDKALPAGEKLNPALWWSVIFGANLGGNITPIGSASTLVAVTIIHKHKIQLSFAAFVKKAIPFALFQILLAIIFVVFLLKYFI